MALMTSTDLVLSLQISLMTWICDGRRLATHRHTEQQMESLETNLLSYQGGIRAQTLAQLRVLNYFFQNCNVYKQMLCIMH